MDSAMRRVASARTVMDLVRAANSRPATPGYVAWSPDIKRSSALARQAIELKAKEIVKSELARLDALQETAGREVFQRELGAFQRDLRYIGPLASGVIGEASRHIHANYLSSRAAVPEVSSPSMPERLREV